MAAFRPDHLLVRDYVTAQDHLQYSQLPDGVVCILLTHSNLVHGSNHVNHVDIRLDLHLTIEDIKERFRKHIGTPVDHQRLILKEYGVTICEMADNKKMLGFYSVRSGMEIHVIDTDPFSLSRGGGLTDVSLVQKYTISDEAYEARKGTVRDYIKQQRALDPNFKIKPVKGPVAAAVDGGSGNVEPVTMGPESVEGITVGVRCEISPGARRGVVAFVGPLEGLKPAGSYWVGVVFDEPVAIGKGDRDGTVKGVRVFECAVGFGGFVKGPNVTVETEERKLPPLMLSLDDDEDEL